MKFTHILKIAEPCPITSLDNATISELQRALAILAYPVGDIDGLIGPKTKNAWFEFKTDVFKGNDLFIAAGSAKTLVDKVEPILSSNTIDYSKDPETALIKTCAIQGLTQRAQIAYVLATVKWETAQTFKPVREAFWETEDWRKTHFKYYPYYGRGYVQLTWETNYRMYSNILGKDLVKSPDVALAADIAGFILVHGFKTGTFTGRKLDDYINEQKVDYINARRCINGLDKAETIAQLAREFYQQDSLFNKEC